MTAVAQPGSGNGLPYGETGVGAEAPPPPPPAAPTAVDGRLVEYQRLVDDMGALLQDQAATIGQLSAKPAKRPPSKLAVQAKQLPRRYAVPLCIAGAVVATTVGITQCSPRLSEDQVAEQATLAAVGQVAPYVDSKIQQVPQVAVVAEPLSVYGLELTENAKTAIGWRTDSQTGAVLGLNTERAEFVARQVRVLSASFKLLEMRLTSTSPTELRVTTNLGEGFPLFEPPSADAPAPPSTTATSAP